MLTQRVSPWDRPQAVSFLSASVVALVSELYTVFMLPVPGVCKLNSLNTISAPQGFLAQAHSQSGFI